jgi:Mn-dependent DtxR family transcriptional regulator
MNANQKWVLSSLCGEKGRYTLGVHSVINRIKKHATTTSKNGERKHIKPHYLMHSLSRRGLVTEIDKDVWILTPRGQVYVREVLRMEPTGKADGVSSVA